jgi:hypothetical protein
MKLNLLPTYVGRGRQLFLSIFIGIVMVIVSTGMSVSMIVNSKSQLERVKAQADAWKKPVDAAAAYAMKAEPIVAPVKDLVRNIKLAKAMEDHNPKYALFYDSTFPYIPGFFRITSIQATPNDASSVTLTMTGVIKTHQQYVDLMLALLRIPGATTISRSGFQPAQPFVGGVTATDQDPVTRVPGKPVLPKDRLQQLDVLIASGGVQGFQESGNFGTGIPGERGPMPGYQLVTVTVQVPGNLTTPNPRATLAASAGGGGGAVLVRGNRPGGGGGGGGAAGGAG